MAIECCFCLIFVVAPVLGIVVVYGGFNIHNAYTFYFGGKFLNEEEWNRVMVPIYLFIVAGILSVIIPIPLVWGLIKRNSRVLILYLSLMGMVIGVEITAWVFVSKNDMGGSVSNVMGSTMQKYYNYNQPERVRNISVEFWDNFQINLKCCGLAGPSDWADASGAPTVGFIPDSCCLNRFQSAGTCARKITRGNMDDGYFVSKFIYTEGCFNEFDYYYSVDGLGHIAIAMAVFQLFGILLAAGFLWKGPEENGYQNLDENHDDTSSN